VTVQQVGYEAIISIRDLGPGIPLEEIPHIFDRYYRVPGVETQPGSHNGLGLGLYISRKLIERHAGRIDVQSTPGEGSTFSIVLPLFVDPTTEDMNAEKLSAHTQAVWTIAH
jgi:signal transduction histidine kinase